MKIGIMADSHDNLVKIKIAAEIFNKEKIDLLLYYGDLVSPFTTRELKNMQCPFGGVFSNNNGYHLLLLHQFQQIGQICPWLYETKIDGKKLLCLIKMVL